MEAIFSVLCLAALSVVSLFGLSYFVNLDSQPQRVPVKVRRDDD